MTRERFEELVAQALEEIPGQFRPYLDEVVVLIEDEPSAEQLRAMGLDPRYDTLYGLYEGTPLSARGATHSMALPDRITIFYRPIVQACPTPGAVRREIRRTVVHEIAHFFGLDEDEVRREGY